MNSDVKKLINELSEIIFLYIIKNKKKIFKYDSYG